MDGKEKPSPSGLWAAGEPACTGRLTPGVSSSSPGPATGRSPPARSAASDSPTSSAEICGQKPAHPPSVGPPLARALAQRRRTATSLPVAAQVDLPVHGGEVQNVFQASQTHRRHRGASEEVWGTRNGGTVSRTETRLSDRKSSADCKHHAPINRLLRRLCSLSLSNASPANTSMGLVPSGHLLAWNKEEKKLHFTSRQH